MGPLKLIWEWLLRWHCGLMEGGPFNANSPVPKGVNKISDYVYSVHEPAKGSPGCEIVFIPGPKLSDCNYAYWQASFAEVKDKYGNDIFWPVAWLVKEFPNARILSLSYDPSDISWTGEAGEIDISSLGESLLQDMVESAHIGQRENCPIVFVCYSLGVLVVKEVVIRGCKTNSHESKYLNFLQNLRGFFFYATPYDGSKLTGCNCILLCKTKSLLPEKGNKIVGRVNAEFEHIATVDFSNGWRIENVSEATNIALHRLGGILRWFYVDSKDKESGNLYHDLLELVHAATSKQSEKKNDFKLSMSKLFSSIREELKTIRINVVQCSRLVDRIAHIIKELEVHQSTLEGENLAKVQGHFLILLMRSRSLVVECGGSDWVETALIRANNKEAFEEVHKELTKFLCNYMVFSGSRPTNTPTNAATLPPRTTLLYEAKCDLQNLLEKLKSYKGEFSPGPNLEQPTVIQHLEKIIQVVSDKNKDQASIPVDGQDSFTSFLQIPQSEVIHKRLIGTGSYGDVYEVEWLGCKMCLKDFPWSGGYGEQWLMQAMPLLSLRHPNVLQLVGFSPSSKQQPKVLTEIMQGDIRSLIDRRMEEQNSKDTPFEWCMTVDIMTQVARGLDSMHTNGFMHGDRVLTTNIIIKICGDYIDARIGDFGVPLDIPVEYVHVFEPRVGDPEGAETARWIAPEVSAGTALYTPTSDIYSFGIFCYELLTGRKPFDHHANVAAVHSQILTGELRPELPDNLDERVADIIHKCWHVDPSSRPHARAIVDALENIQFPVHQTIVRIV